LHIIMNISQATSVYIIGIGGIGVSAIARMLVHEGKKVAGSDRGASEVTDELTKNGVTVYIGHDAKQIPLDCDLLIYTVAVPTDNPELVEANRRGIFTMTYPQTLKDISAAHTTIAVTGTHGKTTVTAMIATIFIHAGLDPTVIVGSLMHDPRQEVRTFGSVQEKKFEQEKISKQEKNGSSGMTNFIPGKGPHFIVEADEYKKSFHNIQPTIVSINNLDLDHLDFYKDLVDIQQSFREVVLKVPPSGLVVANVTDPHVAPVIQGISAPTVDYTHYIGFVEKINLKVPGAHNRSNAAVAVAVAKAAGIEDAVIEKALSNFQGTWRRFEYKGLTEAGALVYDDYAHNPQKVAAAIAGAREMYPTRPLHVVFQPHLYSRTKMLFDDFVKALRGADHVGVVPIYAAREAFDPTISSEMLVNKLAEDRIHFLCDASAP
jgi:UDP-N-acetylmuramate--alanine ligase